MSEIPQWLSSFPVQILPLDALISHSEVTFSSGNVDGKAMPFQDTDFPLQDRPIPDVALRTPSAACYSCLRGRILLGTARELPGVMDVRDLQISLESALAVTWPSRRDLRDALVRYYVTLVKPLLLQSFQSKGATVDGALIRQQLNTRLAVLWGASSSRWDDPSLDDLIRFRERIESFAGSRKDDPELKRARQLLSDLFLATAVAERLRALRRRSNRRGLRLIKGGGELTAPRHTLRLVSNTPVSSQPGPNLPEN